MKTQKFIETWLPGFPGFYHTQFEPDIESEAYSIADIREEKGLNEIDNINEHIDFDNDQYELEVVKQYAKIIFQELNEILDTMMEAHIQGVYNPREYNFKNDAANIKVYVNEEDLLKIQLYVYNHKKEFKQYLRGIYTPRDGFLPFYSDQFTDWEETTGKFLTWEDCAHEFGSVLNFIFSQEKNAITKDHIEVYEDAYILNIEQLQNENICEECGEEFVQSSYKEMYHKVVKHYTESWNRMTGGQKIPGFYTLDEWLKKVNPGKTICAYCADDMELNKAM